MCYGAHDKVAPYLSSVRLDAALTQAGVDHAYLVCEHSGHGLQNDDDVYLRYMQAIEGYRDRYLPVNR